MDRDISILGAFAVGTAVLLSDGRMLFHPSQWTNNKRSLNGYILELVIATGVGIIPALLVVKHFRKKFTENATPKA